MKRDGLAILDHPKAESNQIHTSNQINHQYRTVLY